MKKIIVLVLTLALCATSFTSCKLFNKMFNNPLKDVQEMYGNSAPTMVVATTKQVFKSYELNNKYELKIGQVDGKAASVFTETTEELETIESAGGSDIVKPFIKTTTKTTEAIEGIGARVNGGEWNPSGTTYAIGRGAMALNLDKKSVTDVKYENHTLTFTIPNANIATVLGDGYEAGVDGDIKVTIVDDGAVVTSIELRYTLAGNTKANLPASEMIVFVEYHYDIQHITVS